jgi:hypothetical protein
MNAKPATQRLKVGFPRIIPTLGGFSGDALAPVKFISWHKTQTQIREEFGIAIKYAQCRLLPDSPSPGYASSRYKSFNRRGVVKDLGKRDVGS